MDKQKKHRYCILYIPEGEQQKLVNILKKYIPTGRGEAFYPCMEYYRRDVKKVMVKPIFPGYVFLYTDLNIKEVHSLIRERRAEIGSGMRELALANEWLTDKDFLFLKSDDDEIYELSDVNDGEAEFLDYLRKGNGLLAMSSGYEVVERIPGKRKNKKEEIRKTYIVMEGPLKVYENKIVKIDKHERRAYLEFEINGSRAQAGFNCLPKAHWFPDKNTRIVRFEDGTEADLTELEKSIMTVK